MTRDEKKLAVKNLVQGAVRSIKNLPGCQQLSTTEEIVLVTILSCLLMDYVRLEGIDA